MSQLAQQAHRRLRLRLDHPPHDLYLREVGAPHRVVVVALPAPVPPAVPLHRRTADLVPLAA